MEHQQVLDLIRQMQSEPVPDDDHLGITDAFAYAVRLTGDDDLAVRSVAAAYVQMQNDLRAGHHRPRTRACLMASVNREHGAQYKRNYNLFASAATAC